MKEAFERLLEENGVKVPKAWAFEPKFIFAHRSNKFWAKWSTAFDAYKQYACAVEIMNNERLWRKCQSVSVGLYHKPIVRTPTPVLGNFSNPQEAVMSITSALSRCRDPRDEVIKIRLDYIKQWFFDIVEKRPAGCKLIVLKDTAYTPKPESAQRFDSDVLSKVESMVFYCTGVSYQIYWISVPIEKVKEQKFECWSLRPDSTVVEYY